MEEQTEKVQSKKAFPRYTLTWLLPIVALGYFDGTSAVLITFFLVPFIVLFIFLINIIAKRFSFENQLRLVISFLAVVLTGIILFGGHFYYFSPGKMFEDVIVSPIPETVEIIKKSGQLTAMGISSFYIVFNISKSDFEYVLGAKEYTKKNISNIDGRKPKLYREAVEEAKKWLDDTAELYVRDDKNSFYRCRVLVTNKTHDRVYYRIF